MYLIGIDKQSETLNLYSCYIHNKSGHDCGKRFTEDGEISDNFEQTLPQRAHSARSALHH